MIMSQLEDQAKNFVKYFFEQYPQFSSDKGGSAMKFTVQDSEYRIYSPSVHVTDNGNLWTVQVKMDHIRGGDVDDHCTLNLWFQKDGAYTQPPTADISFSGDNWESAINFVGQCVDVVLEATGAVEEVVSAGLGIAFAPETVGGSVALAVATDVATLAISTAIDVSFQLSGKLASYLEKLTDDGGRAYFSDVIAHAFARLQCAFMEAATGKETPRLEFSFSNFKNAITVNHQTTNNGKSVEYYTASDDYRSWQQDFTVSYHSQGMMISGKIDRIRDNDTDDHILIMVNCGSDGKVTSAQCSITMDDENTITVPAVTINADGQLVQVNPATKTTTRRSESNIFSAFEKCVDEALKKLADYSSFSDNRKQMPTAAAENLQWIQKGVKIAKS
jgi:hypothetical protein